MKHLLLLGGGHAHLEVLRQLAEAPMASAKVTLVSPNVRQVYSGMLPGWVAGHYGLDDFVIPLAPLAQRAGVTLIDGMAVALDAKARRVTLANGDTLDCDVLSLDTGSVPDRDAIPGAREHALFVRPFEQFIRLWVSMLELAAQRSLNVVVVGGGAAGVELSMAVAHRLGSGVRVALVTGGGAPLCDYPEAVQVRVRRALKKCRVTVFEDRCVGIRRGQLLLAQGMRLACDAPLLALGGHAPPWLADSGLALDENGFVLTGPTLQSHSHPEVFAAGDLAVRPDAPRPHSGVYAVRAGPPLALNLRRFMAGGELVQHQPQPRSLNLLSCGEPAAIASWAKLSVQGRWVWKWKNRIDRGFVGRYIA